MPHSLTGGVYKQQGEGPVPRESGVAAALLTLTLSADILYPRIGSSVLFQSDTTKTRALSTVTSRSY